MTARNRFVIDGELVEPEVLRYTPAGIARIALKIRHTSTQQEAGAPRQVQCEIPALALGAAAIKASGIRQGQRVRVEGFLDRRSLRIAQLVLHIDNINVLEEGA
ncbi:MAG: primosomal replication protein N [Gallionellaceae bacterium]|jgi:primosomal replication protein N|nr:primosomal replication protein N [Gallionellaceae bacterium]